LQVHFSLSFYADFHICVSKADEIEPHTHTRNAVSRRLLLADPEKEMEAWVMLLFTYVYLYQFAAAGVKAEHSSALSI
jgi:hypothetical protein